MLRNDSNTCAGGVGLCIKDTIKFRVCDDLLQRHSEDLWIEIESKFSNFIFVVIYRYPKQKIPLFCVKLCGNLSKLENKKLNYIVVGDSNINTLAKNPQTENHMNDFNSFGCNQLGLQIIANFRCLITFIQTSRIKFMKAGYAAFLIFLIICPHFSLLKTLNAY